MPQGAPRRSWHDIGRGTLAPEVAAAVTFFRAALGEDWPGWTERWPLANIFFAEVQRGPAECVRLHRMFRVLENVEHANLLTKDLGRRSWRDHVAAVMALEFCSRFHSAGHRAELVKPESAPRPDARIKLDDRWVTVEFKALHDSDDEVQWYETLDQVFSEAAYRGIDLNDFEIELTSAARGSATAIVNGLAAICASDCRNFVGLPEGTGQARLAERRGVGTISPPVTQNDDVTRIEKRLLDVNRPWSRQLATTSGATLLVVRSKDIFSLLSPGHIVAKAEEIATCRRWGFRGRACAGGGLALEPRGIGHSDPAGGRVTCWPSNVLVRGPFPGRR